MAKSNNWKVYFPELMGSDALTYFDGRNSPGSLWHRTRQYVIDRRKTQPKFNGVTKFAYGREKTRLENLKERTLF